MHEAAAAETPSTWRAERFQRPSDIVERTRWLFVTLALLSLVVSLPAPLLAQHSAAVLLLAVAASFTLTGYFLWCYLNRRVPVSADVVCAAAIWAFALSSPQPSAALSVTFAALWFFALYGSTLRAVLRCCLYVFALGAAVPMWSVLFPGDQEPAVAPLVAAFPIMFITVIVARQLGEGLMARERLLRRDSVLAATGLRLLATKDDAAIRAIAWEAAAEVCAATPGLRVLRVQRLDGILQVTTALGTFSEVPEHLPDAVMAAPVRPGEAVISETAILDAAAGAALSWVCLSISDERQTAWVLVGAPPSIAPEALPTCRSLVHLVQLALRNSDVHRNLTFRAQADSLTGLLNRASFTTALADRLIDRRHSRNLHVLFVDIDDFKDVNDGSGHTAGDEVLVEVAARLRSGTRPGDVCARLGGDEFAVVLRELPPSGAAEAAQRLVQAMSEPMSLSSGTTRVTVSIGVATAAVGVDLDRLVHQADVAMYAAKAQGKNRCEVFDAGAPDSDLPGLPSGERLTATAP